MRLIFKCSLNVKQTWNQHIKSESLIKMKYPVYFISGFFFRREAFKISNMGESFPKTMHMLTMIIYEQQTMPYSLSNELASKPYNHR
jgi:hypothetical protein